MGVPKKKQTRSRTGKRRNAATKRLTLPKLVSCPSCGKPKLPHRVCPHCGAYREKTGVET